MRIVAVIPNEEWRQTGGVRIRYDRIGPALGRLGHGLELVAIDAFQARGGFEADLYLFCKTYDARAPILARLMRAEGRRVGIDVFDDYFSQADDPRFVHMRRWFATMRPALDFALCATPAMAGRLARLAPALPVHVVNDPADGLDPAAIGRTAERNAAAARSERRLELGWFGIGDNPYFSVGLEDLHAFSPVLADARRAGYDARLTVLTNPRALTVERLEMLARLPVETRVEEWSEARERALVAASLACFLPVNAQPFSTVKSLNRGITALAGGAQLLSAGYPLYAPLDGFVYRSVGALVRDLEAGTLKLRAATAPRLAEALAAAGDADAEAARLAGFLDRLPAPPRRARGPADRPIAVIQGLATGADMHKTVQRLQGLTVATPQSPPKLAFDVHPDFAAPGAMLPVRLSERAAWLVRPALADRLAEAGRVEDRPVYRIDVPRAALPDAVPRAPSGRPLLRIVEIARYGPDMALTEALLDHLFDRPEVFLSERSAPYRGPGAAAAAAAG